MIRLRQGYGGQVSLVDYGAGNSTSVRKAFAALGAETVTPRSPEELLASHGIIVPGVGHFQRTQAIGDEWRNAIRAALDRGAALLGVCLGMQWLFEGSEEAPDCAGLGLIQGICSRMPTSLTRSTSSTSPTSLKVKVPHVGWNSLELPRASGLLRHVAPHSQVYFTHSYAAPVVPESVATTSYGISFTSAVERGRVAGVQFHPEKSGDVGLRILRNWLDAL